MTTVQEIDNLIMILDSLKNDTLNMMTKGSLVYDKIGGDYGPVVLISSSGDYKWDFADSEMGNNLKKRWQQWFNKIFDLISASPDDDYYNSYISIKNRISCNWREHESNEDVIKNYETFFCESKKYLENLKPYAKSDENDLSISTEQLNINIDAQQATIIIKGIDDLLQEIKKRIESGDLRVINDEFYQTLNDAISDKDRSKKRRILKSFDKDVKIVNPALQFMSSIITILSALMI